MVSARRASRSWSRTRAASRSSTRCSPSTTRRAARNTMRGFQAERPSIYDFEADIRKITVPTLIVVGDEDEPCLEPSFLLKQWMPTSGLVVLPKTGHVVNQEEPALFNEAVADFIARVEAGRWPRARSALVSQIDGRGRGRYSSVRTRNPRTVAMLSQEQNDLITRIGPGTPAGGLLRRYWQPVALVDELHGTNRPVKPVKLLGESLVLFRDDKGRYGLIERACPHRGTDLAYGRLEDGGLRCAFHGWLFDIERPVPGDAGRAGRLEPLRQHQAEGLSGGGAQRHPVRLHGPGRAAGISALRLLRRARQPHLRVQGHDRLQLAAVARGRHRSGAHLVPASLLPRRGPEGRLRQAVPRHLDRFRNADDQDHARVSAPDHRGRADRVRLPHHHAAADQRPQQPRPRHQPDVPQRLHPADEPRDRHHAMARADRRHQALLVRDLHELRSAGEQGRDAPPAARALRTAGLHPAQEQDQRLRLRSARAGARHLHRHGRRHQRARPVGLRVDGHDPGPHPRASRPVRQGDHRLPPPAAAGDRGHEERRQAADGARRALGAEDHRARRRSTASDRRRTGRATGRRPT